jgi:pimeloyl-ACP methyl ester carboxylesterase
MTTANQAWRQMVCETRGWGTPVVLVHGNPVDHRSLLVLDGAFEASPLAWERHYVDLPGFGASPPGDIEPSTRALAEALVAWAADRFGRTRFAVLAASSGAMPARHLVAELGNQVLGLALLGPVLIADRASRRRPERSVVVADQALLDGLEPAVRAEYEPTSVVQTAANVALYQRYIMPGLTGYNHDFIAAMNAHYGLDSWPETRFGRFDGPSLIVTGRQDWITGYEDQFALLRHYPRATYAVLDAVGHNTFIDGLDLVRPLLTDWLARLARLTEATQATSGTNQAG